METLYHRCCGLDVHKASIAACIRVVRDNREPELRRRRFQTFTADLISAEGLANGLQGDARGDGVHGRIGSRSGTFWKTAASSCCRSTPRHYHALPGRKTDPKDSAWLAELLSCGLLRSSFVPSRRIRQLRDLTRYRVQLKQDRNRIHNRIHKVLEDANVKLDCVATDILGVSGRGIIEGLIESKHGPEYLADRHARSRLREKLPDLRRALRARVTDHHRLLLRQLLDDLDHIDGKVIRIDQELVVGFEPDGDLIDRLCTIPGIDILTAWTVLAELGTDMAAFPDANHLASWAGLCPGLNESAGKRRSGRTRPGDRYLRRALCQAAWAVSHTKDNYLAALFYRIAGRGGLKKASVAVAHQLLRIAYHVIRDGGSYRELGGNYFDLLHPEQTKNRLVHRLSRLGYEVRLEPRDS